MQRPIIFICHSLGGIIVKRVRRLYHLEAKGLTIAGIGVIRKPD